MAFDFTTPQSTTEHVTTFGKVTANVEAPWADYASNVYPTLADAFTAKLTLGRIIGAEGSRSNVILVTIQTEAGDVIEDELYPVD
jgi:hypothetical protein